MFDRCAVPSGVDVVIRGILGAVRTVFRLYQTHFTFFFPRELKSVNYFILYKLHVSTVCHEGFFSKLKLINLG